MKTVFVDATSPSGNWGKFMVGVFDTEEVNRTSAVDGRLMVWGRGWGPGHILVVDLQTGEGAIFRMGGSATADLAKHSVWVCVLFEAFLDWLYHQPDPMNLPPLIELDVPFAMAGYRRNGREDAMRELAQELLTTFQRFALDANGTVESALEKRAAEFGLDTKGT